MTYEVHDSRPIEVADKRRLPVQLEPEALEQLPTPFHLAMYATLCALAGTENRTAPGLRALAAAAHMGHTKAAEVLNDLESAGYVARTRTVSSQSGMQGRTIYSVLGVEAVRHTDTADTGMGVRHADALRQTDAIRHADSPGYFGFRHADSNVVVAELEEEQQHQLVARLVAAGVSENVAFQLATEAPDEVQRQLAVLDQRTGIKNRAAALVMSVREAWAMPPEADRAPEYAAPRPTCAECEGAGLVFVGGGTATVCLTCR